MRNKILVILFAATIAGMGFFTVNRAAAEENSNGQNPMQSLVAKIAQKFGLKQADVQTVVDQHRTERETLRENNYLSRLDQLVADKKITVDQKQLIIAKNKELRSEREQEMEEWRNKTADEREAAKEERRTERETERTELLKWASDNGIEMKYLMGGFGGRRGGGKGGGMMRGGKFW